MIHVKDGGDRSGYIRPMSTRKIIIIDEQKCTGCGLCIPNCPEGALQVIDGKVRLVSDLFCDGLGACIGYCPEGAIAVAEREAEPYNEKMVMANIARQGANTIRAHLEHLDSHGERELLSQALAFLKEEGIPLPDGFSLKTQPAGREGTAGQSEAPSPAEGSPSELVNWPVQLQLLSPMAPQHSGKDFLLSADCVSFAMADFHKTLLKGKFLAIACPKLDESAEIYREKIIALIDHARIITLTVAMIEVPCCRGLLKIVQDARAKARRKVPVQAVIVGPGGGAILSREWV